MPELTETGHTPITLLVGPPDCFERECEEYVTEEGDNDPGVERCSHITDQTVCEQCSTERPDGEYEPVVPWTGPHTAAVDAVPAPCLCGQPVPEGRVAYCSDACRLADKDHGPDEDAVGGDES